MYLNFKLDNFHNRQLRHWRGLGNVRKHAREHGAAGVWRANDSFVLFYRDGNKIRQKTWKHARPA